MNKKEKSLPSTSINWYPGHMEKAKREMVEMIKMVDMVIELRDSRIPLSSENPLIGQIVNSKPTLIVLSKKDKAEKKETVHTVHAYAAVPSFFTYMGNQCKNRTD